MVTTFLLTWFHFFLPWLQCIIYGNKIMQIHWKPAGLEDKDPKTESGFSPKIMQKHFKPGSLEDQDPKSEISKMKFTS